MLTDTTNRFAIYNYRRFVDVLEDVADRNADVAAFLARVRLDRLAPARSSSALTAATRAAGGEPSALAMPASTLMPIAVWALAKLLKSAGVLGI